MNSVPLQDALPWGKGNPPSHGCCIFITDSIETDGRFLLHTLSVEYLSNSNTALANRSENNRKVLWLSCEAYSGRNILAAIKKISKESMPLITDRSSPSSASSDWEFISICDELSTLIFHAEEGLLKNLISSFARDLFGKIKQLLSRDLPARLEDENVAISRPPCWLVVIDDVSILRQLLGCHNTLALIQSIRAIIRSQGGCLAFRASNTLEREKNSTAKPTQWAGAGGELDAQCRISQDGEIILENILAELADGVVDVLPLPSGFSREAHGRLLLTEVLGAKGWNHGRNLGDSRSNASTKFMLNYFCDESDVKAIHLRTKH